jgi:transposase-like zinc ribbon protein
MAMNKVQNQRGLSMLEFFDSYGSQEDCEALVRSRRWPEGFICPRCRGSWHSELRREGRLYFQCSACARPAELQQCSGCCRWPGGRIDVASHQAVIGPGDRRWLEWPLYEVLRP